MSAPRAPRIRWTEAELDIVRAVFPVDGAEACTARLPGRNVNAVRQQALKLGVTDPTAVPAGLRAPLAGGSLDRALELRRQGWSYRRIGEEFGICESAATNAVLVAECIAAGFTPAKRDSSGGIVSRDAKRLQKMLLDGMRHVDIQRQLGISANAVSHHRRRLAAELKAKRQGKLLPPHGGGKAYSGLRITAAQKREVEALFLEGFGAKKINARTGMSHTSIGRIRNRLIRRLRRKGECLPGCDFDGNRLVQKGSNRYVPDVAIAELRRRLLDREPVARAARDLGIGGSSAYRIRDELAAELAAKGEQLPPPLRLGSAPDARIAARKAAWLPKGMIYRYRALVAEHGPEAAKAILLDQLAADRRAEAARPKTFEDQLRRVRAGAGLTARPIIRKAAPDMTLGGVATGAL